MKVNIKIDFKFCFTEYWVGAGRGAGAKAGDRAVAGAKAGDGAVAGVKAFVWAVAVARSKWNGYWTRSPIQFWKEQQRKVKKN